MVSVLVLTKNEETDLPACLASVRWSDDVHVLDSFSTDRTRELALAAGARVTQREFDHWAAHQNWAVQNIPFKYSWVLYIDADERVSSELASAVIEVTQSTSHFNAYRLRRRDFARDGTWLKHAQISPFLIRLFRPERIRYERTVNPVAVVDGSVGDVRGFLDHYPFSKGLDHWVIRHLQYAQFEASMRGREPRGEIIRALFDTDFNVRRAHQKRLFMRIPGRPMLKFLYMVLWRRAFLDGRAGVRYAALQSIYEYFITLKEEHQAAVIESHRFFEQS